MLILNRQDVVRLLSMQTCVSLMEDALASLARGEVILPLRPILRVPDTLNVLALMPAYSKALNAIGTKLITVFPGNHGTDLDSHQGIVVLIDSERGALLAIMDAASITAIRTAATSGAATRLLARKDASTVTIVGAGVQGRAHIDAMLGVLPFKKILIWSRNGEHARALAGEAAARHCAAIEAVESLETAVRAADVVCTVTASREPVVLGKWLKAGAHVNAVGASVATARELDTEAVKRSRVYVDRRESALNEAGDVLIPMRECAISENHIIAELGNVIIGTAKGRQSDEEITLFKSLGLAVEDLACAHYLHDRARHEKAGTWVEL